MKYIYNLTIIFLITTITSCSTQNIIIPIKVIENPFLTIDSIYKVTPSYDIESNSFNVQLTLEKLKDNNEYYFPSSEQLRVIVKDKDGNIILSTAKNKDYFLVVTPLEPKIIGNMQSYEYNLNGFDVFEKRDEINLYMILPTKPNEIYFEKKIRATHK